MSDMGIDANVSMLGVGRLVKKLERLAKTQVMRVAGKAISEGAKPMKQAMRAAMPKGKTGNLKRSVKIRRKNYRRNGVAFAAVGPSWPKGAHGHLLEKGTVDRYHLPEGFSKAFKAKGYGGKARTRLQRRFSLWGKFVGKIEEPAVGAGEAAFLSTRKRSERIIIKELRRGVRRAMRGA